MGYKVITDAVNEPLSLADAKKHLRLADIGGAHPDDDYVSALITAARVFCEHYTGRSYASKTVEVAYDDFPENEISLVFSSVSAINSIKYIDVNGAEQTVSSNDYMLDEYDNNFSFVLLKDGAAWPETSGRVNNVRIQILTGSTAPETVKAAMKLIVGNFYENRQQDQLGTGRMTFNSLPLGVESLLHQQRVDLGL